MKKILTIISLLLLSLITMGIVQSVVDDISWRSGTRFFGTLAHNIDQPTTWTFPNESGVVVLEDNISSLSNKTFENSNINGNGTSTLQNVIITGGSITNLTSSLSIGLGGTGTSSLTGFITSDKLANNSITSDLVPDNIITTNKIANEAVTTEKIGDGAITRDKVDSTLLDEITVSDGSITSIKIQDETIQTIDIADNVITELKIADNAITSSKIDNNEITLSKLNNSFLITSELIADNAVISSKIPSNSISGNKLINNTITTDKIVDGAITEAKLSPNAQAGLSSKHIYFSVRSNTRSYGYGFFINTTYRKVTVCRNSPISGGTYYFLIDPDISTSSVARTSFRIIESSSFICATTGNNAWYNGTSWDNSGFTTLSTKQPISIINVSSETSTSALEWSMSYALMEEN